MKNTMKLFWLLAAASVVLSCSKEAGQNLEATPGEEKTPAVITPATDGNLLTSFGVTFEGDVQDEETKVSVNLGTGVTAMEENDEVLVFVDGENNAIYKYDGEKFVLEEGETAVALDAPASVYYPASEFAKTTADFTMPAAIEASGDFGAFNPMAGVITGEPGSYSVTLGNIASVLRVQVSADVNIISVSLNFGSDVTYAAGSKFSVDASTKEMTAKTASAETTETVTLGTPGKAADVLFILPTLELSNGLTVTANLEEEHNGGSNSFSISKASYTPVANKISSMSFYAGLFSGGAGKDGDPYLIASLRDFKNLQKYTTEGYTPGSMTATDFLGAHYLQIADIDFKKASLTPIGDATNPFDGFYDGFYDGDSKSLQNIAINASADNAGVFGYMNGGTVKNLNVSGTVSSTANQVGGIVGYMAGGTIEKCSFTGDVTGMAQVGGIVGDAGLASGLSASNICKITACRVNADVESVLNGASNVGGLVGRIRHSVIVNSCYAKGSVTGAGYNIGGLVGQMVVNVANAVGRSYMFDCLANMDVTATRDSGQNVRLGGAVGYIINSTDNTTSNAPYVGVDNCVVAPVTITASGNNVGGFVGALKGNTADTATDMKNRLRLRNNCTFVSSVPGGNGFMGTREDGQMTLQYNYCAMSTDAFFEGSVPAGVTRQNCGRNRTYSGYATTLCDSFNEHNYSLTINSVAYSSALEWTAPDDVEYIVPGALTKLGEEYYK